MQTKINLSEVLLTVMGLGLLVAAVLLNHYHPHNQGVAAATTRNSIARLALSVADSSRSAPATFAYMGNLGIQRSGTSPDIASADKSKDYSHSNQAVETASATYSPTMDDQRCLDLDDQQYKNAQNSYGSAYLQYQQSKNASHSRYKSDQKDGGNTHAYYQSYLNSLDSAYSSYKLAMLSNNCQPLHSAPQPEDE